MTKGMKSLFIIVNAGFSEQIVELLQQSGATGATIIPARGTGQNVAKILGIHFEPEKEIVLSVVKDEVAQKVTRIVKEKYGKETDTNAFCFILPIDDSTLNLN